MNYVRRAETQEERRERWLWEEKQNATDDCKRNDTKMRDRECSSHVEYTKKNQKLSLLRESAVTSNVPHW